MLTTSQKAALALSNRLFINSWTLREDLMWAVEHPRQYTIELEFVNKRPVGVALLDKRDGLVSIFVRKKYRRNGVGTKLINKLKNSIKKAGYGIVGSDKFFNKVGIAVDNY